MPLFGTERRQLTSDELSAKAQVRIALIELKKMEDDLASDVENYIRDLKIKARSVKLAIKARELAQKKLEVEQIKAKAGRSSTFQIVTFQSDLFTAKYNELETKVSYLDALNDFDKFLGTTLDTWKIDFKTQRQGAKKSITEVHSDR
jgi:outer membrane protein TolC